MARRYLTRSEAASAIRRQRTVEAFLGGFDAGEEKSIRRLVIYGDGTGVSAEIWESPDIGSEDFADVYEFGTLDHDGEPAVIFPRQSLEGFLDVIDAQYPGTSARLVNEGVVQDEYLDYKRNVSDSM